MTAPDLRAAVRAYKAGLSLRAVAHRFQVDHARLRRQFRAAGCPMRRMGRPPITCDPAAFRAAVAEGLTVEQLGERFTLSRTTVTRMKRDLNAYHTGKRPYRPRITNGARSVSPEPELFRCPSCGGRSEGRARHAGCEG